MQQNMEQNSVFWPFNIGLLCSLCCFNAAIPAIALQGPRKVLPKLRTVVARMQKVTQVPIVLPTNMAAEFSVPGKFYSYVDVLTKNEYEVDFDMTATAHGDENNSFGFIAGRKITGKKTAFSSLYGTSNYEFEGDDKAEAKSVILAHGIKGYYVTQDRGANLVFWHQEGYSYVVGYKGFQEDVVRVANSAILNER